MGGGGWGGGGVAVLSVAVATHDTRPCTAAQLCCPFAAVRADARKRRLLRPSPRWCRGCVRATSIIALARSYPAPTLLALPTAPSVTTGAGDNKHTRLWEGLFATVLGVSFEPCARRSRRLCSAVWVSERSTYLPRPPPRPLLRQRAVFL